MSCEAHVVALAGVGLVALIVLASIVVICALLAHYGKRRIKP